MFVGDKKVTLASALIGFSLLCGAGSALAHSAARHASRGETHTSHHRGEINRVGYHSAQRFSHFRRFRSAAYSGGAHVIQCVAFAKQDAGIEISGNARDWWGRAAGIYERGSHPEQGSVLSFQANGRIPLGHVAVVSAVADSRTIFIDQSHWNSRGITRDMEVQDVSEANDWSAVRVQLQHGGAFGSIYPTHGFIYPRPDSGAPVHATVVADATAEAPAPRYLRHAHVRAASVEVAEAPETGKAIDLTVPGLSFDSPSRSLR